jgi:hypothetical protein
MSGRDNISVATAALFVGVAALAWPRPAQAQPLPIGGASAVITLPRSVTFDQAAETSLADIDTVQLPAILQQDTATATSVTTPETSGAYTPIGSYISSLNQQLLSGVNSQNLGGLFPGWQALPPTSTQVAKKVVSTSLQTYASAEAIAESQANELAGENFNNIEATSTGTTALLTAVQANTEAALQVASELQYVRQLLITMIVLQSTNASENLNERAQMEATNAMQWNGGVAP